MKHPNRIFRVLSIVCVIAALVWFSTPAVKAEDTGLRVDRAWYWTPAMSIPDHSCQAAPALAMFNGDLHMVHMGSSGKNLYHCYYNGVLWSESIRISSHMTQATPAIAAFNGKLHLVQLGSNNTKLYHSTYDGNSWTGMTQVLNYTSDAAPALAEFGGSLHMVHKTDGGSGIVHSTFNGTSWTDQGVISGLDTQAAPGLAFYNNQLHMAYLGASNSNLWHSYYNGVSWTAAAQISTITGQYGPTLAECDGDLHMVNKSGTATDIYHSSYDGISWASHGVIPSQTTSMTPVIASYDGPMHIIHPEAGSSGMDESIFLPQVCITPSYQPEFWNFYMDILRSNNCYNYSNNKRTDTFAQPGKYAGQMYTALTCAEVERGAIADGVSKLVGDTCLNGETKIAMVVAPGYDYHWYRQDSNGLWSHKPGGTPATNLDNSGEIITNPETADRGNYTDFCGYFCSCESDIPGISHETIRSAPVEQAAAETTVKNGLKVTILVYSGRQNPTFVVPASEIANKNMIVNLLTMLDDNSSFRGASVSPSHLGYNGILVERIGNFNSFPYETMFIYRENVEVPGAGTERARFMLDGGQNLEDFLVQLAVEKGALNTEMLKHIK
jgi:hypothetical protein